MATSRLPVYLLLDTSGSMHGEPIQAVNNGLKIVRDTTQVDPNILDSAWFSVITFDSSPNQIVPLTEAGQFHPPDLSVSGLTNLGSALEKVVECVEKEVVKGTKEKKGDWRPMLIIMTDGAPTDSGVDLEKGILGPAIEKGIQKFRTVKWGMVVGCAAGPQADATVLHKLTECVVQLASTNATDIAAFFKWVSASIVEGSKSAGNGKDPGENKLPPPPPEVTTLPPPPPEITIA